MGDQFVTQAAASLGQHAQAGQLQPGQAHPPQDLEGGGNA